MSDLKLSLEEIRNLMDAFAKSGLTDFTLSQGDFELSFGKNNEPMCPPPPPAPQPGFAPAMRTEESAPAEKPAEPAIEGNVVKSPIVGTFYASPSPEKPAYASVGKKVEKEMYSLLSSR